MAKRTAKCRHGRAAIIIVVGVVCLEIGAAGGVWFAQRYLQPPRRPPQADASSGTTPQPVPHAPPVATDTDPRGPAPVPAAPSIELARADESFLARRQSAPRKRGAEPRAATPTAPRTEARSASPQSFNQVPTLRRHRRAHTALYTCPRADHVDATTKRAGNCPRCKATLVSAHDVPHGLQAMAWYAEHEEAAETPPSRPTATPDAPRGQRPPTVAAAASRPSPTTSRPVRIARRSRVLYTCPKAVHVSATTTEAGRCPLCQANLVPAGKVLHGLAAMQYYANREEDAADPSDDQRPPLYTCPTAQHVDLTTTQPGDCPLCGLELMPVGRVGHEARAVRAWMKKQAERRAPALAKGVASPPPLVLYTCLILEHVDVTTRRQGNCPRCGLTLRRVEDVVHKAEATEAYHKRITDERARRTNKKRARTQPTSANTK